MTVREDGGRGGRRGGRRDQSAVDVAIAAPTALRSEPDGAAAAESPAGSPAESPAGSPAESPADERAWLYRDVTCGRCGAVVQVVKFSPQHTSVQWTAGAALTCAEFAAAGRSPGRAGVPVVTCVSLRASISAAVADGRIEIQPP